MVSRTSRLEYLQTIQERYQRASKGEKHRMLNEFCKVPRYHRKYALRLLNGPRLAAPPRTRRRRPTYPEAVTRALAFVWKAAGYPWSVRLKALLPLWLPRAQDHLRLPPEVIRQVSRISPRQMDRRLKGHKRQMEKRLYGRTKTGALFKNHIPLRTDRWDVTTPRGAGGGLGAHSRGCAARGDPAGVAHQSAADGPAVEGAQAPDEEASVRADQTGDVVEAPHPVADRPLGCDHARVGGG